MKRWLPDWKYIAIVAILAVLTLMVMDFNSRMADWRRLTIRKEEVAAEATHQAQTQASLQTRIAFATSPAGVKPWAYEHGKYAEEDVVIVVPIPYGEATPISTPVPILTPEVVNNWQLWLSLFFDPESPVIVQGK